MERRRRDEWGGGGGIVCLFIPLSLRPSSSLIPPALYPPVLNPSIRPTEPGWCVRVRAKRESTGRLACCLPAMEERVSGLPAPVQGTGEGGGMCPAHVTTSEGLHKTAETPEGFLKTTIQTFPNAMFLSLREIRGAPNPDRSSVNSFNLVQFWLHSSSFIAFPASLHRFRPPLPLTFHPFL